jgi:Predicted transcriptional regulators
MVSINKNNSRPYYEQLMIGIKEEILQGILQPGDQVPSVREMAKQLLMNPNTVSKAYKLLESEQVLITVKGKGTFVRADAIARDEERVAEWKQQLTVLLIEAKHLQITTQEMKQWFEDIQQDLGGDNK